MPILVKRDLRGSPIPTFFSTLFLSVKALRVFSFFLLPAVKSLIEPTHAMMVVMMNTWWKMLTADSGERVEENEPLINGGFNAPHWIFDVRPCAVNAQIGSMDV